MIDGRLVARPVILPLPAIQRNPRRKFSDEEDKRLKELVSVYGAKNWDKIAELIPGRTGRQCRDRYRNYLIPGFFNGQWTREEDDLLRRKFEELGPKWARMTHYFNGRSANALKNRWNYFVCRDPATVTPIEPVAPEKPPILEPSKSLGALPPKFRILLRSPAEGQATRVDVKPV